MPIVRPKDAASLILIKEDGNTQSVLMGRRPPRSRFIPDAFVFPGGRVDPEDQQEIPSTTITPHTTKIMSELGQIAPSQHRSFCNAVIRETQEETGLLLTDNKPGENYDHGALRLLGRAITPTLSPVRFHARFFISEAKNLQGTLKSNGELLDLDWYPIEKALDLPIIDVTECMLKEAAQGWETAGFSGFDQRDRIVFMTYRGPKTLIRHRVLRA